MLPDCAMFWFHMACRTIEYVEFHLCWRAACVVKKVFEYIIIFITSFSYHLPCHQPFYTWWQQYPPKDSVRVLRSPPFCDTFFHVGFPAFTGGKYSFAIDTINVVCVDPHRKLLSNTNKTWNLGKFRKEKQDRSFGMSKKDIYSVILIPSNIGCPPF